MDEKNMTQAGGEGEVNQQGGQAGATPPPQEQGGQGGVASQGGGQGGVASQGGGQGATQNQEGGVASQEGGQGEGQEKKKGGWIQEQVEAGKEKVFEYKKQIPLSWEALGGILLGIVALILCSIGWYLFSFPFGVGGVVLGLLAFTNKDRSGAMIAISISGLALLIFLTMFMFITMGGGHFWGESL